MCRRTSIGEWNLLLVAIRVWAKRYGVIRGDIWHCNGIRWEGKFIKQPRPIARATIRIVAFEDCATIVLHMLELPIRWDIHDVRRFEGIWSPVPIGDAKL